MRHPHDPDLLALSSAELPGAAGDVQSGILHSEAGGAGGRAPASSAAAGDNRCSRGEHGCCQGSPVTRNTSSASRSPAAPSPAQVGLVGLLPHPCSLHFSGRGAGSGTDLGVMSAIRDEDRIWASEGQGAASSNQTTLLLVEPQAVTYAKMRPIRKVQVGLCHYVRVSHYSWALPLAWDPSWLVG
jgi:hypothetical protein